MVRQVVLMSGYPAAGKSTLAAALADRLDFALVSKDAFLLTLYTSFQFGPNDAVASLRTGAAAWAAFWLQASMCPRVVLDTNIQYANLDQRERLAALGGRVVEVRCECPPELAAQRFAARSKIGHAAQRFTELTADRLAAYAQPIGLGALVSVDTRAAVDVERVAAEVRVRLAES